MNTSVVDLFCGVGGMTHGLEKEGLNVVAGLDVDASCKYAYEKNNEAKFILKDVKEIKGEELVTLYPKDDWKVLVGCAPCQPFSTYNKFKKKDDKWKLLNEFSRLITELQPDVVSMENVPQLESYLNQKIFGDFVENLNDNGYSTSSSIVKCSDYGVPQMRKRLVLLASKLGPIKLIEPDPIGKTPTVREKIGNLDPIRAGEVHKKDKLHRARGLTPVNLKRIKSTPEGGGWTDWPTSLRLRCHKAKRGQSFKSVYGRMRWDKPGPTITTQCIGIGNGRFGHPEQDRALSLREAALLQTFPKDYDFIDPSVPFGGHRIATHIGNAVPVNLSRAVGKTIKFHISEHNAR